MFLRTFWWNYKKIRMTSLCFIHLQLIIVALLQPHLGCLKRHEKKRMFFGTFFTWNNTFFATLRIKQQSKCTCVVLERTNDNYIFMYISSELQRLQPSINIATYQGNWQELTIQKNSISLSHVNIFHIQCLSIWIFFFLVPLLLYLFQSYISEFYGPFIYFILNIQFKVLPSFYLLINKYFYLFNFYQELSWVYKLI